MLRLTSADTDTDRKLFTVPLSIQPFNLITLTDTRSAQRVVSPQCSWSLCACLCVCAFLKYLFLFFTRNVNNSCKLHCRFMPNNILTAVFSSCIEI